MKGEQMEPTEFNYDKSGWHPGEWEQEPDRDQWVHAGFACLAIRNRLGAWCGYVGVPNGHPAYEKDYDNVEPYPEVHGGLTYASPCSAHICHVPEPGMPDDVWWLGFDTAHLGDLVPGMEALVPTSGDFPHSYKNLAYVKAETERLADQLAAMA